MNEKFHDESSSLLGSNNTVALTALFEDPASISATTATTTATTTTTETTTTIQRNPAQIGRIVHDDDERKTKNVGVTSATVGETRMFWENLLPRRCTSFFQDSWNHQDQQYKSNNNNNNNMQKDIQNTLVGSTIFLLYQIVFCLAQAATITRPHAGHRSTGVLARTAALGVITAGPLFLWELADSVPAMYPASDLFLAPFLADLARTMDDVLWQEGLENDDTIFMATFGLLLSVGFVVSGSLCILAARVQWANIGAFLPYSVLCGFFTTIGVLMWTLGFSVDVGHKIGEVVWSGDGELIRHALWHHAPSLGIGIVMHVLGPQNPLYVVSLVMGTMGGSYLILWMTGTSLEEAQAQQWFFSATDLVASHATYGWEDYAPPNPLGVWVSVWRGKVHWEAFFAGMPMILALVVLYLVRCSLHAAALKKNIPLVTRTMDDNDHESCDEEAAAVPPLSPRHSQERRGDRPIKKPKEALTLNYILEHGYGYTQLLSGLVGGIAVAPSVAASLTLFKLGAEKPPPQYGSCLLVIIFYCSSFTLVQYIPKPAFSSLMVLAGLDMIKSWIFESYWKTKAKMEWLVGPILVVLSFTLGVLNAIVVGVAISTFLFAANVYRAGAVKFVGSGVTLRSTVERGVVESNWLDQYGEWIQILVIQNYLFFGNAQTVLSYVSTMLLDGQTEEEVKDQETHDKATATIPVSTWWNRLPPKPKYLVIDFSLVSGMDTSSIDILKGIVSLCKEHQCQVQFSGLKPFLKANMTYAGLVSSSKQLSFAIDLESALAKAEDALLSVEFHLKESNWMESEQCRVQQEEQQYHQQAHRRGQDKVEKPTGSCNVSTETKSGKERQDREENVKDGFLYALQKIDEQHGLTTARDLAALAPWTIPVELNPGDILNPCETDDANAANTNHGLYFVETGLLRVQKWSASHTMRKFVHWTWNGLPMMDEFAPTKEPLPQSSPRRSGPGVGSGGIGSPIVPASSSMQASATTHGVPHGRSDGMAHSDTTALWKQQHLQQAHTEQTFRLARISQGWIIGSMEVLASVHHDQISRKKPRPQRQPGVYLALSSCRLHHLPPIAMATLEDTHPRLAMHLYRILAHLATKRQELTISHLGQHLRILNSPVPRLKGRGKVGLKSLLASDDYV